VNSDKLEDQVFYLSLASILHDIDALPGNKPAAGKDGVMPGMEFLQEIPRLEEAMTILEATRTLRRQGQTQGLKGEQIPLGARILAVASQFDVLTKPAEKAKDTPEFKPEQNVVRKAFTELGNQANETFDMGVSACVNGSVPPWHTLPGTQKTIEAPPPSSVPEADA